jgi:hypothetical protein
MQSAWALFESQAYEVVEDLSLEREYIKHKEGEKIK